MTPLVPPQPLCTWAEPTGATGWTADMLARLPEDGWRYELVEGRVVRMAPTGFDHGRYESRLDRRLGTYVEQHGLGEVVVGEPAFDLTRPGETKDTVLAADIAFIRAERLPVPPPRPGKAFTPFAPDLVIEVASPTQYRPGLDDKARRWLDRGARLVWVLWPEHGEVDVLTPGSDQAKTLTGDVVLDGGDVVPGFRLPLPAIWGTP